MSGSTIGGVVGGVIGFFIGGPAGFQWGFMIGSAIGGYVDPVKVQGPRLKDAMQQTSQEGVPIPFGYGTFPTAGNIIWSGELVEHKKKERQGKGGGAVTTTYTYTRSYAIGICEGPIAGLLLVKRNGKVVWDARDQPTLLEFLDIGTIDVGHPYNTALEWIRRMKAWSSRWANRATFYLGDEAQLADPTIEAAEGVGNVSAFRGLAYMVVKDDDVTELQGAIPQYEFVVATRATAVAESVVLPADSQTDMGWWAGWAGGVINAWTSITPTNSGGACFFKVSDITNAPENNTGAARIRVVALYETGVVAADRSATAEDAALAQQAVFDTGWYAASSANAEAFTNYMLANGQVAPVVSTVAPPDAYGSLPRSATGFMVYAEVWAAGNTTGRCTVAWPQLDPAITTEPLLDLNGVMLGSDGVAYLSPFGADAILDSLALQSTSLSEIVTNICARVGVTEIDTAALTANVLGYKIATESGADGMIAALMPAFFFDAAEFDGKLHFIPRGGNAAFSLSMDDLADRDGEAMTVTRVQEAELLRKVTVGYLDPNASYSAATQTWERRAATVQAKGESAIEIPLVCSHAEAAQIAEKRGKVAWSETDKIDFVLPALKWARLTPADVGEIYLRDGSVQRVRIASVEEDSGRLLVEAARDRQAAYIGTATGVRPPAPILVDPPLVGFPLVAVMDLPVLREADDALGIYIAAGGGLGGFVGSSIQASTDDGASSVTIAEIDAPATIGSVVTGLAAWSSAEYPSQQSITVSLPDAPESLTREALLRYGNRAAVRTQAGWEVLQYQTATTNPDGTYTLGGLVRGRYATTPGAIGSGAMFVLLDRNVQFVPIETWAIGQALKVRAVPIGLDPDRIAWTVLELTGESQREWPPHVVDATRDGSDTVTVSWVGRGRIGVETAPRMSQFFAGYRVTFSDGFTADTTVATYTRPTVPAGVTVSVAALNSITGVGPSSEAISV